MGAGTGAKDRSAAAILRETRRAGPSRARARRSGGMPDTIIAGSHNSAYHAVPAWSLEGLSDEFRREEGRLEDRRDPREVGLLVFFPAAGVSDSYDARVPCYWQGSQRRLRRNKGHIKRERLCESAMLKGVLPFLLRFGEAPAARSTSPPCPAAKCSACGTIVGCSHPH